MYKSHEQEANMSTTAFSHPNRLLLLALLASLLSPPISLGGTPRTSDAVANPSSSPSESSHQEREPASRRRGQEKTDAKPEPSPTSPLLVEKGPVSALVQCARSSLEEKGWGVLEYEKEKKQLSAFRVISAEELARVADTKKIGGQIDWAQARASLSLSFFPVNDNRTRIEVRVRILGEGATSLAVLRPSNWSALPSTGALESEVLDALQAHCGPAKRLPSAGHGASGRKNN